MNGVWRKIYEMPADKQFGITLEQHTVTRRYRVSYGADVKGPLTYEAAATELGSCILHRLACSGTISSH